MATVATRRGNDLAALAERVSRLEEALEEALAERDRALKGVAALAVGIAFHRGPQSTAPPRTIPDACRVNGVHGDHAAAIEKLFS